MPTLVTAKKINTAPSAKSSASSDKGEKKSHHTKKQCRVAKCTFHGIDQCHRLVVHVKNSDFAEKTIEKLSNIVCTGNKQRGKEKRMANPKKKVKKLCPVPLCDQIIIDIGHHLGNPNTHNIKEGSRELQRLMLMVKTYTGLGEMEMDLAPPPPAILEVAREPSSECDATPSSSGSAATDTVSAAASAAFKITVPVAASGSTPGPSTASDFATTPGPASSSETVSYTR